MSADSDARKFEKALGDFREASSSRKAAQSAFRGKRLSSDAQETLLAWLGGPEGQERCKAALKALKAERRALKSLLKLSRKLTHDAPAKNAGPKDAPLSLKGRSAGSAHNGGGAKAASLGLDAAPKTASAA